MVAPAVQQASQLTSSAAQARTTPRAVLPSFERVIQPAVSLEMRVSEVKLAGGVDVWRGELRAERVVDVRRRVGARDRDHHEGQRPSR
jgi:hypothetical protein